MIRKERRDDTLIWTVDRPSARNAIDQDVVHDLELAVGEVESDSTVRSVVLTGSGDKAFISGADLKGLLALTTEARTDLDARMDALLERIATLPLPVIAVLNGVVIGGGAEVALACDLRIAEPHASITFKHAAMGVTPGWGGLTRLTNLVSHSSAARLLFTAEAISSDEALRIGLIDEITPPHGGLARALALAAAVAKTSPTSVAQIKRLLRSSQGMSRAEAHHAERQAFLARAQSDDHREALSAYFEKREPRFTPRPS